MSLRREIISAALLAFIFCMPQPSPLNAEETLKLVEFNKTFKFEDIEARDAKVSPLIKEGEIAGLKLETGNSIQWPGITIKPSSGKAWNLSEYKKITMTVKNTSSVPAFLAWRIDNEGGDGDKNGITLRHQFAPGEQKTFELPLNKLGLELDSEVKFIGMHGTPFCDALDASAITCFIIFSKTPEQKHSFEITSIQAEKADKINKMKAADFFPFIDRYGQYRHSEWLGKIHSDEDMKKAALAESEDLKKNPPSPEFDEYGAWKNGPQLKSTGFFRTEKYNGKWYIVAPNGHLFWSHGVDGVRSGSGTTPITDRKNYFSDLPTEGPLMQFYGKHHWAPRGYYKDVPKPFETYNFTAANLYRKYGDNWKEQFDKLAVERLKSWQMNTIGNWSDADICAMRKIPYVRSIGYTHPVIEGSNGIWGKFPDPFHPDFRKNLAEGLKTEASSAKDPFCMGYFIDNELGWNHNTTQLGLAVLNSPSKQPARQAAINKLKEIYPKLEDLNKAWNCKFDSWDKLSLDANAKLNEKMRADLEELTSLIANEYFKVCREESKKAAPDILYLGCRFASSNNAAVKAAAKYCDIVSYNIYQLSVADFKLPENLDKPVIIGEFHFGALDRGMLHTGLVPVKDQKERAEAYANYINGALKNPALVGAHWFLFGSQATSGRGDGENYQVGLVDLCDTPYSETIEAVRNTGRKMYQTRSE